MTARWRRAAALALGVVLCGIAPVGGPAAAVTRTNIVVLMLDDMPQEAARTLFERTKVIKREFLQHGQEWLHFYSNDPLCCPGRAGFLTGLWSQHHGVIDNDARLFRAKSR